METELIKLEQEFSKAIVNNDAQAVDRFVTADWVIVDPDGGIVDRARFLEVIRSGALVHEAMDSTDFRIKVYGDTAVVTAVTVTKGKFMGQAYSSRERATDVFVKQNESWRCALTHLTRMK